MSMMMIYDDDMMLSDMFLHDNALNAKCLACDMLNYDLTVDCDY